jgi:hypothetical protein
MAVISPRLCIIGKFKYQLVKKELNDLSNNIPGIAEEIREALKGSPHLLEIQMSPNGETRLNGTW